MTLSIEVLPAPLGPMIARISPLRISNETSVIAFTPPKLSETFSTESNASPAAISLPVGDLTALSRGRKGEPSRRLLHDLGGHRVGLHFADRDVRGEPALAAVLEGHLDRNIGV